MTGWSATGTGGERVRRIASGDHSDSQNQRGQVEAKEAASFQLLDLARVEREPIVDAAAVSAGNKASKAAYVAPPAIRNRVLSEPSARLD
jgi:hypothetical protein